MNKPDTDPDEEYDELPPTAVDNIPSGDMHFQVDPDFVHTDAGKEMVTKQFLDLSRQFYAQMRTFYDEQ